MANKEYTINRFGKKTKYRKVGSKYYRIKADGTLAKDAATGLILANLKNAPASSIVSSPDKMLATVRSAVAGTNKRGQMGKMRTASASDKTKDDGGKAKLQFVKDIKKIKTMPKDGGKAALQKVKTQNKEKKLDKKLKALSVINKDANIKTDSKPLSKKKDNTPLKRTETKKITTTKTKALQNKPTKTETNKKKTDTKKEASKKSKGFLDRFKEDFKKAVKETKRNFQGDFKKGTGRYKSVNEVELDSKGNYKGTNIKPTALQLSRMKKKEMMRGGYSTKKKMMGGGYAMKKKKK
jgi:hypothetical protein